MWFFIVLLIILNSGNSASACGVRFTPPTAVVKFGGSLSVNCSSVSCSNMAGMGWESPVGGISLTSGVTSLEFKITKVDKWEYRPMCFISFLDAQPQKVLELPVTVYQLPEKLSMSNYSTTEPFVEGRNYLIQCQILDVAPAGKLSVSWYKGNKVLFEEAFTESSLKPVSKSSVLNLKAHRADDGSEIWCDATLNFTAEDRPSVRSASHRLSVLYPPAFIQPANESLKIRPNTNVTLDCEASGNPDPVYNWSFAHSVQMLMLNPDEKRLILTGDFQLSGTYSCTASNKHGSTTKYFLLEEDRGNRTTFAALLGGFGCLALVLLGAGLFLTPNGTFSFKNGYLLGRPSAPI